jgi:tetratricopeptide (TPR) repeat protein
MRLTEPFAIALLAASMCGARAWAAPSEEIADLAARIEYGYYAEEPRVIEAARAVLDRAEAADADTRYYTAYAAFRLAQLAAHGGADAGKLVDTCIEKATPPRADAATAEQWVLVAACAEVGGQARRRDQALERARALDPQNPRLALVDAWAASPRAADADAALREEAVAHLEHAVAAFDARPAGQGGPDWGEAEALASLGQVALARGDAREARDLIERALLVAPDYRLAVELRARMQGARAR